MPAITADPEQARVFARAVVDRLRGAGYEALWAGGCVRDELLGRTPADYDVATSARPEEVRALFGRSRTLALGVAFGVITVIGPKGAGQVEVTTFRTDADYADGRHPTGVAFSTAREDAQRRDFSINGLFLDPLTGEVHDYVGGRADLAAGVIRAIGDPALRFGEDHLRLLRAVRFAAGFGFALEPGTRAAVERFAGLVATVSPERIATELRAMFSRPGRGRALVLLRDTGLFAALFPEFVPAAPDVSGEDWEDRARRIEALDESSLPAALAILAEDAPGTLPAVVARLRLSNREGAAAVWLRSALDDFLDAAAGPPQRRPWSTVQPRLAHRDAALLADALRARAATRGTEEADLARWVGERLARARAELDPPPLLGGDDLRRAGFEPGPEMGLTLARLRALQLDGVLRTPADARRWLEEERPRG